MKLLKWFFVTIAVLGLVACGGDSNDSQDNEGDVSTLNKAPIANAGTDTSMTINETITLIGIGTDNDGTIVDYEWKEGDAILANTASFDYTATILGIDTLKFTVMDDDGEISSDTISIEVVRNEGKWITPTSSDCENGGGNIYKNVCEADWEDAKKICHLRRGKLATLEQLKQVVINCGGEMEYQNSEEWDRNRKNASYQACYKEKGFTPNSYWSSTPHDYYPNYALFVNFSAGVENGSPNNSKHYVKCVKEES